MTRKNINYQNLQKRNRNPEKPDIHLESTESYRLSTAGIHLINQMSTLVGLCLLPNVKNMKYHPELYS